jgi:hypothetical protein
MRARHHLALLVVSCVAALTACGGSSSTPDQATTSAAQLPGQLAGPSAALDQGSAPAGTASASGANRKGAANKGSSTPKASQSDPISARNHTVRARHRAKNEQRGTGVGPLNPCTLVTRTEAAAILGQRIVGLHQAPQGPTCIYEPRKAKSLVTMAVQLTAFDPKKQPARNVTRVTLRGHKAYCVKDHGLAMLVPLAAGHVLRVAAPCPIAAGFASKALARLYP